MLLFCVPLFEAALHHSHRRVTAIFNQKSGPELYTQAPPLTCHFSKVG
jgi:hypothetical protein